ncbi:MAG TPA: glucose 1-dehydrogenase [Methylomirabilota bacterium]|nr:glucose 1-dehydrogenase [Methylomirabilota bacterium]
MGRLEGKVAAITGGASGIGEATARRFAAEGAAVAIADIDAERGRLVAGAIEGAGGRAMFVETHAGREADAMRFVRAAAERWGRLDVLVNNAGMRLYQTVVDASEESWDAILAVNVKGYAFCAKAAIPLMRQVGGGSIVNVASIRSVVAGGNMVQYDTTKAAVAGLTRAMAMDHAADRIRVNAVCPGPIFTRFHERRAEAAGRSHEDFRAEFGRGTMLGRAGTPEEVAACILFLASDDASYVTGASLYVDGGHTAR